MGNQPDIQINTHFWVDWNIFSVNLNCEDMLLELVFTLTITFREERRVQSDRKLLILQDGESL